MLQLEIVAAPPGPIAPLYTRQKLAKICHLRRLFGRKSAGLERSVSLGSNKEKHAMGHLNALNITALKARMPKTLAEQRRAKLISKLEEQRALADAQLAGQQHVVMKQVWAKDAEGNRTRVQREKQIKAWWWKDGDALAMTIRYGSLPLELARGKRGLRLDSIAAVPAAIATVIEAVKAGELDAAMESVINGSKTKQSQS